MAAPLVSAHLDHLPLFPLPETILFPSMRLPLHIFEPRYRQMVRDAQSQGLPIAIGLIRASAHPLVEPVPVRDVMGAGFIDEVEELPDGRFLIELVGSQRVRIVEEKDSPHPYRVIRAEPFVDFEVTPQENEQALDVLRRLILAIHRRERRVGAVLSTIVEENHLAGSVADAIAAVIQTDALVRQSWLEEKNPARRLQAVTETLEEFLAQLSPGQGELN